MKVPIHGKAKSNVWGLFVRFYTQNKNIMYCLFVPHYELVVSIGWTFSFGRKERISFSSSGYSTGFDR